MIQSEIKDIVIEIKNNVQGNKSGVDEAESQINDLEHKEEKTTNQNNKKKRESKKKRRILKKEDSKIKNSVSSLWDNFKQSNFHFIGFQKEKRKSKKLEIYLKK